MTDATAHFFHIKPLDIWVCTNSMYINYDHTHNKLTVSYRNTKIAKLAAITSGGCGGPNIVPISFRSQSNSYSFTISNPIWIWLYL